MEHLLRSRVGNTIDFRAQSEIKGGLCGDSGPKRVPPSAVPERQALDGRASCRRRKFWPAWPSCWAQTARPFHRRIGASAGPWQRAHQVVVRSKWCTEVLMINARQQSISSSAQYSPPGLDAWNRTGETNTLPQEIAAGAWLWGRSHDRSLAAA
jgi:hypothetical protein